MAGCPVGVLQNQAKGRALRKDRANSSRPSMPFQQQPPFSQKEGANSEKDTPILLGGALGRHVLADRSSPTLKT